MLSSFTSLLEILIIATLLNYLLSFFWNTRSMDLLLGLLGFLFVAFTSSWFNLPILHKIMYVMANVAVIGIVVIFQPELRMALSKFAIHSKRHRELIHYDKFLDQLTSCIYKLSEKEHGAIVVLENTDSIQEFSRGATPLNADFSPELLETIFCTPAPLHDGAVLIRDTTILAAAAILPLADDHSQVQRSMGTRHRAALGASSQCDAIIIVVSEETGKVSIARDGVITRGLKADRFRAILKSIFSPIEEAKEKEQPFNLVEWLRR